MVLGDEAYFHFFHSIFFLLRQEISLRNAFSLLILVDRGETRILGMIFSLATLFLVRILFFFLLIFLIPFFSSHLSIVTFYVQSLALERSSFLFGMKAYLSEFSEEESDLLWYRAFI